jgi:coenzyme F420-reducing hydrogenase delta subunit/Pyruvate/2-oxoacid:ferredoxin oxidoreductase delta subunit
VFGSLPARHINNYFKPNTKDQALDDFDFFVNSSKSKGNALDSKTLIMGNSRDARQIAEELLATDGDVIVAIPGNTDDTVLFDDLKTGTKTKRLEVLPVAGAISCSGSVGRFNLRFKVDSQSVSRTVSSIILADDVVRKPNSDLYGIAASTQVVSLSRFHEMMASQVDPDGRMASAKRIAFITGLADESNPVITREVMTCALKIQQTFEGQTYIFTGNLKVAGNGLEALYRQTKKAGTVYMKFTETIPEFQVGDDGGVSITYVDEIIHETFKLNPDVVVVDEVFQASAFSRNLSKTFEIDIGPDGFVQSDNVHRATVFTNRKGIFVAGFSRHVQGERELQTDVSSAVLAVRSLYKKPTASLLGKAEINYGGHCVGCLTCFRSCPYGAISLEPRVSVDPQACEGCGICAAECPRFAITINTPEGDAISQRIPDRKKTVHGDTFMPSITAFCCSRSARRAGELASCMGHALPAGLHVVEVPCAGSISRQHLFSAFSKGADGVLVLTCHKGNCHSEEGNVYARQRVDQLSDMLPQIGFESERLAYKTLASNMGTEFAEMVNGFEKNLLALGPSRLKDA